MRVKEGVMRCPKCGYVSFDHLEKCLKCSRDLKATRGDLNLLDFKPEVPFLLGSLVGEMQGGGAQRELSLTQETELELSGFETGESYTTEGTLDIQDLGGPSDAEPSGEVSLSEIALDDLETIEASALGDTGAGELKLDDLAEVSSEDEGFLGVEFDADESPLDDLGTFEESSATESVSAQSSPGSDLDLDLDEDDLSALARELEGHLDAETGAKKKAGADDPGEVILEMEDD